MRLTDARCDGRATLLIASTAPVARQTGDSVLTRALTCRLIARLIQRTDRVTVAPYTHEHDTTAQCIIDVSAAAAASSSSWNALTWPKWSALFRRRRQ